MTNKKPTEPGVICADCAYTFAELRNRGFGAAALREMQRNGLPSREFGRQKFVLGAEFIAWLNSLPPITLPLDQAAVAPLSQNDRFRSC